MFAAGEARAAGYGGIAAVSRATGIAASIIGRGLNELVAAAELDIERVRRPGGGRKSLVDDLLALVSPGERGDPMSPLRWTGQRAPSPGKSVDSLVARHARSSARRPSSVRSART